MLLFRLDYIMLCPINLEVVLLLS